MRIAVIAVSEQPSAALAEMAKAVEREFVGQGHQCEGFRQPESRLSFFDFLVVCAEPRGWGASFGNSIRQTFAGCSLTGKRAMALLRKKGFRPQKALSNLMNEMEKEGMVVPMGDVVATSIQAREAARNAPLIRG
ncbi:MAG: hypothetical protein FD137_1928 [Spirochaetes bacterium]|nr:MAG: hypothetical protein FD137_1928 [Spirochaetota bacterium]